MKQLLLTSLFCLSALSLFAQQSLKDSAVFAGYTTKIENERQAAERQKNYRFTAALVTEWIGRFNKLPDGTKAAFRHWEPTMYYNMACYEARLNNIANALTALEKAAKMGYHNYTGAIYDSDLKNLHDQKRYRAALQIIWKQSEMAARLRQSGAYNHQSDKGLPQFTYQDAASPELVNFKNKFNLDSVAGNGNEISKIKNLLRWVHNTVRHNGENWSNPPLKNGLDLIEICRKEKRPVNCRMLATILKDVYQAEGFKARLVTCMPKDTADQDCHVINVVWSKTLDKWLWMDPTYNGYVTDLKGNLLSIEEVRAKLYEGKINDLTLNSDANWNNEVQWKGDYYFGFYMSKNLYWLQCTANSEWDIETDKPGKTQVTYINLYPQGYKLIKSKKRVEFDNIQYATNNAELFWQKPALN